MRPKDTHHAKVAHEGHVKYKTAVRPKAFVMPLSIKGVDLKDKIATMPKMYLLVSYHCHLLIL